MAIYRWINYLMAENKLIQKGVSLFFIPFMMMIGDFLWVNVLAVCQILRSAILKDEYL